MNRKRQSTVDTGPDLLEGLSRATYFRRLKIIHQELNHRNHQGNGAHYNEDNVENNFNNIENNFNNIENNFNNIENNNEPNIDQDIDHDSDHENVGIHHMEDDIDNIPENANDEHEIDSDENEEVENNNDGQQLLYDGARLTVHESLISILTFFLRHSLSGIALVDLLELIEIHCPPENSCKKTIYFFHQHFSDIKTPVKKHFFCSNCFCPLASITSVCQTCPINLRGISYFIQMPITNQLQKLYNRPDFYQDLQKRFNRQKTNVNNYEDIKDGRVYQEMCQPGGKLSNPQNISFMWNTDGVRLFKSSNFEIWPFFLTINELPFHLRKKKENLILGGLWFGNHKPVPLYFMNPISHELRLLANGVNFQVPSIHQTIRVQCHVICGTCDLPAKAMMMNMKQWNATYGCQKCLIRVLRDDASNVPIYEYTAELQLRNEHDTIEHGRQAVVTESEDVYGVKGPCPIRRFVPSFIRCTAIDTMHSLFLGLVKQLVHLWFSRDHQNNPWSLYTQLNKVDEMIREIKPPTITPRLPRTISESLAQWKAHEYKTWFYYYSLPILEKINMPESYLVHYQLLVNSICLLNQPSISDDMINFADELLHQFVKDYEGLYGRNSLSANLHSLLHLADNTRDFAQPYFTSCFSFENINGQLSTLVSGTRFSGLQISTGLSYFMALPGLLKNLVADNIVLNFCEKLTNSTKIKKYKTHRISTDLLALGSMGKNLFISRRVAHKLRSTFHNNTNVNLFYRIMKSGIIYTSTIYKRVTKTNSSWVKYQVENQIRYGLVYCFTQTSNCECTSFCSPECGSEYFAVIQRCDVDSRFNAPQNRFSYINKLIALLNEFDIVEIKNLITVCFNINIKCSTDTERSQYVIGPVDFSEND